MELLKRTFISVLEGGKKETGNCMTSIAIGDTREKHFKVEDDS